MLTFIHGSDVYLVRQAAERAARTAPSAGNTISLTRIDCSEDTAHNTLSHLLKYPSFLQEHIVIIAHRASSDPDIVGLIREHHNEPTITIVATHADDEKPSAQTKKQCAILEQYANTTTTVESPTGPTLLVWIKEMCNERNTDIEPSAARLLMRSCEGDFWRLTQEIEKLAASSPHITEAIVQELVTAPTQEKDPWALSDAIYAGDKRKAIASLWQAIREGTSPELLVGTIAASLRALLVTTEPSHDRTNTARTSGIHPFVLGRAMRGAQHYAHERLLQAHTSLAHIDRDSKSGVADALDRLFTSLITL